jgi:hypothetical protein
MTCRFLHSDLSCFREEDSIPLADDDPSALLDESVTDFLHEDLKKVSHQTKDSMTHHWLMSSSSYSTVLMSLWPTFCTRISRRWVTRQRTLWLITDWCQAVLTVQYWWVCDRLSARGSQEGESPDKGLYDSSLIDVKQFLQYWWKWCSFSAWGSQEGESPEKELYDSTLIDIKQLLLTIMKLTFCTRISRRWVTRKRTLWLFPDKIKMLTLCWPMNGGRRWILKV